MGKKDQIYGYILGEVSLRGIPPTIREIGSRFDISSTNGVRYFLDKLESEGLIERRARTARGIKVVGKEMTEKAKTVPLLGRVPAGEPVFSEENLEDTILLDENLAKGEGVFAVTVKGDSMIDAGINDGDIAVVRRNPSPISGDIVVALIEDEVTLKRFVRRGRMVVLKPENENYEEIDLGSLAGERVRIIGTVQAIVRRY